VPIHTTFAGYEIYTRRPDPAAVLLQALNMLEHVDLRRSGEFRHVHA
jgi:gamma-glutamyltranspeptidase